jgi:hypothetical protein
VYLPTGKNLSVAADAANGQRTAGANTVARRLMLCPVGEAFGFALFTRDLPVVGLCAKSIVASVLEGSSLPEGFPFTPAAQAMIRNTLCIAISAILSSQL